MKEIPVCDNKLFVTLLATALPLLILQPFPLVQLLSVAKSPFVINSGPNSLKFPFLTNSSEKYPTFSINP